MAVACGDDGDVEPAAAGPTSSGAAATSETTDRSGGDPSDAEDLAHPDPADHAEPSERESLEAACFHGSTEACDRLGH